jgi:hypothetical protein
MRKSFAVFLVLALPFLAAGQWFTVSSADLAARPVCGSRRASHSTPQTPQTLLE